MKSIFKLIAGFVAIAALGFLSIEMDVLPGSRADAEARLQQRAEDALADAEWARVDMDGQKAVLAGEAPDQAALDKAVAALSGAAWSGGPVAGGVTMIDASAVAVKNAGPPVADPFIWVAERHGSDIVFSGFAPSAAAREAVYRLAATHFPAAEISGELEIARGAPPEDAWLSAAATSLQALTRLEDGAAQATDSRFDVSGRAADEKQAQSVRVLMDSLPAGLSGSARVTAPAPKPRPDEQPANEETPAAPDEATKTETDAASEPAQDVAPDDAPEESAEEPAAEATAEEKAEETAGEPPVAEVAPSGPAPAEESEPSPDPEEAAPVASTEAAPEPEPEPVDPAVLAECRTRLERIIVGLQVSFDSQGTAIEAESQERLLEFATSLMICPYFDIQVSGHTDSTGGETQNRRLSRQRAESVAAFLRSLGVDGERLSTRGAGSSDPLADNSTPEGRALNRRIEFTLAPAIVE